MPLIFLSHTTPDAAQADLLHTLLKQGLDLSLDDVMLSSKEITSVESGDEWLSALREKLDSCKVVLVMMSPNYLDSMVSLMELGAGWVTQKLRMVTITPFDDLGPVMGQLQMKRAWNKESLNALIQEIGTDTGKQVQQTAWESARDAFLDDLENAPFTRQSSNAVTQAGNILRRALDAWDPHAEDDSAARKEVSNSFLEFCPDGFSVADWIRTTPHRHDWKVGWLYGEGCPWDGFKADLRALTDPEQRDDANERLHRFMDGYSKHQSRRSHASQLKTAVEAAGEILSTTEEDVQLLLSEGERDAALRLLNDMEQRTDMDAASMESYRGNVGAKEAIVAADKEKQAAAELLARSAAKEHLPVFAAKVAQIIDLFDQDAQQTMELADIGSEADLASAIESVNRALKRVSEENPTNN